MENKRDTRPVRSARAKRAVTARQHEVIEQVAAGHSNKEIADRMHISESAVKKHLESLRRRYDATNRVQLVRVAIERGDLQVTRKK